MKIERARATFQGNKVVLFHNKTLKNFISGNRKMAIIYLIGARGSGKTTVGKYLAHNLGCPFVDLDKYLQQKSGKTVSEIVADAGWEYFRRLESQYLRDVTDLRRFDGHAVLATGGGVILSENNRKYLTDNGLVFWLKTTCEILEARLRAAPENAQRPNLTEKSMLEEIREVLEKRERLYKACAHHIINSNAPVEEICANISACLKSA